MKHAILVATAALALSACATLPDSAPSVLEQAEIAAAMLNVPAADRVKVGGAVGIEVGIRFRCPRTPLELQLLGFSRAAFDQFARPRIQPASDAIVTELRDRANAACSIPAQ